MNKITETTVIGVDGTFANNKIQIIKVKRTAEIKMIVKAFFGLIF